MTYQVPALGALFCHVSLLPSRYGRPSYCVVVGGAPKRTYMSASPEPPEILKVAVDEPAGTLKVYITVLPSAPDRPVTGTPFCSTLPPPLPVTVAVSCTPEMAAQALTST